MKDVYYFPHDYNARNDLKLQDVLIEMGVEGIGIYWCVIETLYEHGGIIPLRQCKSIAFALHVDCETVERLVGNYGLFSNDGENMWSDGALKRLNKRKDISDKRKQAASAKRQKTQQQDKESEAQADASAEQLQSTSNANTKHKEKEDSPERKKEISVDFSRVKALWKEYCPSFPQPRSLSEDDKRKIRQRFHEMMTGNDPETAYQRIKAIFQAIDASDFCKEGKWCNFRWVFTNTTNWRKVEDGNYNDRPGRRNNGTSATTRNCNDEWK